MNSASTLPLDSTLLITLSWVYSLMQISFKVCNCRSLNFQTNLSDEWTKIYLWFSSGESWQHPHSNPIIDALLFLSSICLVDYPLFLVSFFTSILKYHSFDFLLHHFVSLECPWWFFSSIDSKCWSGFGFLWLPYTIYTSPLLISLSFITLKTISLIPLISIN